MRSIRMAVLGSMTLFLALSATSTAATPAEITYRSAKKLAPGRFAHGPNMMFWVNTRVSGFRGKVTVMNRDCGGAAALGLPMPKYALVEYGPRKIRQSTCAAPGDLSDPLPLPGRDYTRLYRKLKVRARQTACKLVRRTANKGKRSLLRVWFPCNNIDSLDSNSQRTVIKFGRKQPHRFKIAEVVLSSNACLYMKWRRAGPEEPRCGLKM